MTPGPGPRPAVLYVDDEAANLKVFEASFKSRFEVHTCLSGEEALLLLERMPGKFGVLLSDQRMPTMTGSELLARAVGLVPDVQRMIVTAYSDMDAVFDAVNRGQVQRYFIKPWKREELGTALEEGLRVYTLQTKLREVEGRLLGSERLAVLGQVSAGIAHELMSPLSALSANVEVLRIELEPMLALAKKAAGPSPTQKLADSFEDLPLLVREIEQATHHIRELALSVRTQARGEDLAETCDLLEVAHFAGRMARAEVGKHQGALTMGGPSVRVKGGPVKLTQVFLNLIVNAAQALPNTGRPGAIHLGWEVQGDSVLASVKDNGSGIPEAIREKIFEPLFTTRPVGVGTGLGLAICRDIVKGMGGELRLESTVGVGTTFFVRLPVAP